MNKQFLAIALLGSLALLSSSCTKSTDLPITESSEGVASKAASSSAQEPDERIVFTQVVQLEGTQEVPAVTTETKGIAILRVSAGKVLYSKVIIQKLAEGDALRVAHIHEGARGVNGPARVTIAANAAEFGTNKVTQLTDAQFRLITSGQAYVNAHSNVFPGGIVRGQIR